MSPDEDLLLLPVLVLAAWSVFMALWMFATRVPAMTRAKLDGKHTEDLAMLPSQVRAIGSNFSNLFELPIIFYVTAFAIFLAGHVDMTAIYLAWGFVGFRIVHSLIHGTYNNPLHRFAIYMLALFCVLAMLVREIINII